MKESSMRGTWVGAAVAAGLILAGFASAPAEAAKRQRYYTPAHTVVVTRDETGRTRTRIVVTPRSFLDGGTEVLPGERKYSDYVTRPFQTPFDVLGKGPGKDNSQLPLPYNMNIGVNSAW